MSMSEEIELQWHHCEKFIPLAQMTFFIPANWIAKDLVRAIAGNEEYHLDDPEVRQERIEATKAVIIAARHGRIKHIPDGEADIICRVCRNDTCSIER